MNDMTCRVAWPIGLSLDMNSHAEVHDQLLTVHSFAGVPICCQEAAHRPESPVASSPAIHGEASLSLHKPLQALQDMLFMQSTGCLRLDFCIADLWQGEQVQCGKAH